MSGFFVSTEDDYAHGERRGRRAYDADTPEQAAQQFALDTFDHTDASPGPLRVVVRDAHELDPWLYEVFVDFSIAASVQRAKEWP